MRGRTAVEVWSETLRALKLATSVVAVTVGAFIPYYWLQLLERCAAMASKAVARWIWRCVRVRTIHRTFASTWRWQPPIMPPAPRRSDTAARRCSSVRGFSGGHRIYVASLAQDGQIDEARTAANDCLAAK